MRDAEQSRLRSLALMARRLSQPLSLSRIVEIAAEEACASLPAASVSISRLEPSGRTVRTIVNVGELGPGEVRWPDDETYSMDEFVGLDAGLDRLVVWVASVDDPAVAKADRELLLQLGKATSVSAPIIVDGLVWGEMYATRNAGEPAFDIDEQAYLEGLIAILAGALTSADRERTLSALAYRDPLTGLANRRAIDEHAERVFAVPPDEARVVSVVAIDINGLKQANDRFGHHAGDRLIQSVSRRLQQAFSYLPDTIVARVGGDEFNVLLSGSPLAQVVAITDELSRRCCELGTETSLSCGAAGAILSSESELTPVDLFSAADQAQYVAKRERRQTTVVAPALTGGQPGYPGAAHLGDLRASHVAHTSSGAIIERAAPTRR
jgi:diguanylate cyclase (GGDEF)-like protein